MTSIPESYTKPSYKQKLQSELIDISDDLDLFKKLSPQAESIVRRIEGTIGQCIHLIDGADVRELCCSSAENEGDS
jgi:hypothetical protein